jgi:hypothetical protein
MTLRAIQRGISKPKFLTEEKIIFGQKSKAPDFGTTRLKIQRNPIIGRT